MCSVGLPLTKDESHAEAKDYVQAAYWYRKAAEQGDGGAELLLGDMYAEGAGVSQDLLRRLARVYGEPRVQVMTGVPFAALQHLHTGMDRLLLDLIFLRPSAAEV